MHDPYAGYRDYDDPWWIPDPVAHTQWTQWDYALADAIAAIDLLMSDSGHPRWMTEDPDVYWKVGQTVDYGIQTLYKEQGKYKQGVPPEVNHYLYEPIKNGEFWTIEEWFAWREENQDADIRLDRDAPEGARPPTAEEMVEMQRLRQERLDALYAEAAEDEPLN